MNIDPDIHRICLNDNIEAWKEFFQKQRDETAILRARLIALEDNLKGRLASIESAIANKL